MSQKAWLIPRMKGVDPDPVAVEKQLQLVKKTLDQFETIWLDNGNKKFLCGDKISVADVFAACELEQPAIAGYVKV